MADVTELAEADDVAVLEETRKLDDEEFETAKRAAENGRNVGVGGIVRNDGDVLLVQNQWSRGWIIPGGSVEEGESFEQALEREVREETGLSIAVESPFAVLRQQFVHEGEVVRGYFVVFLARALDVAIGDDPGVHDEEIRDVRWFSHLPEETENERILRRFFDRGAK